jgi:glucose-1-phosphate thymidylyltransferase
MRLLGDGAQIGCHISYEVQEVPNGLAQAFVIGASFIGNDSVALVLGDNIFCGQGLGRQLKQFTEVNGAYLFAYQVLDPERYGVVEFDSNHNAFSMEEKPQTPKSRFALPGLYFYDNSVVTIAQKLQPSARGEYEITDVNKAYLEQGQLKVSVLPTGTAWLDTGTFESLSDASEFVRAIEQRQGNKIGCIEEIAYRMGFISKEQLLALADQLKKCGYGIYLKTVAESK